MQKAVKIGVILASVLMLGMMSVKAADELLASWGNYNLNSGSSSLVNGRQSSNDYARAEMFVDSVTSGIKKTNFRTYRQVNGNYQFVKKTTINLTLGAKDAHLGYVDAGTWRIINEAFSGSTIYAGWGGTLTYFSTASSSL